MQPINPYSKCDFPWGTGGAEVGESKPVIGKSTVAFADSCINLGGKSEAPMFAQLQAFEQGH